MNLFKQPIPKAAKTGLYLRPAAYGPKNKIHNEPAQHVPNTQLQTEAAVLKFVQPEVDSVSDDIVAANRRKLDHLKRERAEAVRGHGNSILATDVVVDNTPLVHEGFESVLLAPVAVLELPGI